MPDRILLIESARYEWIKLEGLKAILRFGEGKTVGGNDQVTTRVTGTNEAKTQTMHGAEELFSRCGDRFEYVEDCVEYSDGSILLCAHVGRWHGTFAEETNHTMFFGLMPR